ncbi:hypothetical protein SCHPADRAFT_831120 [Schizopora paradoxa]|uniref:Uncharacterized protein n=1 Tax=Schizopora paradoxa TaxID=27342 RepID=A0A0H2RII1_9AGAM|nr:hypothetical protein SCHPADRAFT_831120 [Schizopora paradoxa]
MDPYDEESSFYGKTWSDTSSPSTPDFFDRKRSRSSTLSSFSSSSSRFSPDSLQIAFSTITQKKGSRFAFIGLVALLVLASFTVLSFNPSRGIAVGAERPGAVKLPYDAFERYRASTANSYSSHRNHASRPSHEAITFTPEQELAALASFITALPSNALPQSVDPSKPIDPELIVDFDVRKDPNEVERELAVMESSIWEMYPVILFAKSHNAPSRELQTVLRNMRLKPDATVIEVDTRVDASALSSVLTRLTGMPSLPILLVSGKPVPVSSSIDDDTTRTLVESGTLRDLVSDAGVAIREFETKGRRKHGRNNN